MVVTTRRNLRSRGAPRGRSSSPAPAKTPRKTPARRKKAAAASPDDESASSPVVEAVLLEDLSKLTREKLRVLLKKHDLPIGKVKQEMIDTLTAYYESLEDAPPGATEAKPAVEAGGEASIVGRRIAKVFDGETFLGTVNRYVKTRRIWKIKYDDGDDEEMEEEELLEALELFHGSAGEGADGEEGEGSEMKRILTFLIPFVVVMAMMVVFVSRDVLFNCGAVTEYVEDGGFEEAPIHHSAGLDARAHEDL